MFLEVILLIMVILVIILPFCIWPIFIAMGVNASYKILNHEPSTDCINCLYGTSTGEWCHSNCKDMDKFVDKRLLNEKE